MAGEPGRLITAAIALRHVGRERNPLWQVDHAHPDPLALRDAARAARFAASERDFYPGVRAAVSPDYADWLQQAIDAWWPAARARVLQNGFALAAEDPAALAPIQRIPHFDTADPAVFALVHYLCHPPHRGTRFYRHRASGFESIGPGRVEHWRDLLRSDTRAGRVPERRYIAADTAAFATIGEAELAFNRLIVYPANLLHAGDIGQSWHNPTATDGRLTITALIGVDADWRQTLIALAPPD